MLPVSCIWYLRTMPPDCLIAHMAGRSVDGRWTETSRHRTISREMQMRYLRAQRRGSRVFPAESIESRQLHVEYYRHQSIEETIDRFRD